MRKHPLVCLLAFHALLLAVAPPLRAYEFPYADPYVATVIGTPKELQAELPARIPVSERKLAVFGERKVPGILWYNKQLRYSIAVQDGKGPLVFLIAGLGAGYNDPNLQFLQRAFFKAGFHVVSLPSPTHPNFITAASGSGIPGNLREDARDLHHVMGLICRDIREKVQITGYNLAGYSLGAIHAAFVAELDDRPYIVLPLFGPSSLRDTAGLAADSTAQYFYLAGPTDMDENIEWGMAYEGMYLIDKRHTVPFRYYQTGSAFEYDLLRLLYTKKREVDVAQ